MPCITEVATGRQLEMGWVKEFHKELDGNPFNYVAVDYHCWGNTSRDPVDLDKETAKLCSKLTAMDSEMIAKLSPQLQYWWKRHQMHDELRAFRTKLGLDHADVP